MTATVIRRLQASDPLEELTQLIHRAFAPLGRMGLACTGVQQTVATTQQRVGLGDCFVALVAGRVVGTVTLHADDPASPVPRYRGRDVCSLHQFAVDPSHQGTGVGQALLRAAESWARGRHYGELALDTPAPAAHLHAFYRRRGFVRVGTVQLPHKAYTSAIFSRPVAASPVQSAALCQARHPAEIALWLR